MKNNWLARLGTGLNKFLNTGGGEHMILTPEPDEITQEGTPFSADRMNHIEQGIYDAYLIPGRNLLDNADWGYGFVNQRGVSGTQTVTNSYGIDRWIFNGKYGVSSGNVYLYEGTSIEQRLEIDPYYISASIVTLSILEGSNGAGGNQVDIKTTFYNPGKSPRIVSRPGRYTVEYGFHSGTYLINGVSFNYVPYIKITPERDYSTSSLHIKRLWLELGETSHMALTPPQNRDDNVRKCQRYLFKRTRPICEIAYRHSSSDITVNMQLPTTLRDKPTISPSSNIEFYLFKDDGTYQYKTNGVINNSNTTYDEYGGTLCYTISASGLTIPDNNRVNFIQVFTPLEIAAEL